MLSCVGKKHRVPGGFPSNTSSLSTTGPKPLLVWEKVIPLIRFLPVTPSPPFPFLFLLDLKEQLLLLYCPPCRSTPLPPLFALCPSPRNETLLSCCTSLLLFIILPVPTETKITMSKSWRTPEHLCSEDYQQIKLLHYCNSWHEF